MLKVLPIILFYDSLKFTNNSCIILTLFPEMCLKFLHSFAIILKHKKSSFTRNSLSAVV